MLPKPWLKLRPKQKWRLWNREYSSPSHSTRTKSLATVIAYLQYILKEIQNLGWISGWGILCFCKTGRTGSQIVRCIQEKMNPVINQVSCTFHSLKSTKNALIYIGMRYFSLITKSTKRERSEDETRTSVFPILN